MSKKSYITILLLLSNLIVGGIIAFQLMNKDRIVEDPSNEIEQEGFVGIVANEVVELPDNFRTQDFKLSLAVINTNTYSLIVSIPSGLLLNSINIDLVLKNLSSANIVSFEPNVIFENKLRNIVKNNIINHSSLSEYNLYITGVETLELGKITLDSNVSDLVLTSKGSTISINGTQYNLEF